MTERREQEQVREFMEAMGEHVQSEPGLPPKDIVNLRARLVQSEAFELTNAMYDGDLVEVIDGVCDLVYVAKGTAVAFGFDDMLGEFFSEVHATNMKKDPSVRDSHGKLAKPEGWRPPNIPGILAGALARRDLPGVTKLMLDFGVNRVFMNDGTIVDLEGYCAESNAFTYLMGGRRHFFLNYKGANMLTTFAAVLKWEK